MTFRVKEKPSAYDVDNNEEEPPEDGIGDNHSDTHHCIGHDVIKEEEYEESPLKQGKG
jgi:hypothetical protein